VHPDRAVDVETDVNRDDPDSEDLGAPLDLLTVADVAAMLRVSKMTVYRMVHADQLRALRGGSAYRIPQAAVEAFLREAG